MSLKAIVDNLESAPEAVRGFYRPIEDGIAIILVPLQSDLSLSFGYWASTHDDCSDDNITI